MTADNNTMSGHPLYLAKRSSEPIKTVPAADVIRAMLDAWLPGAATSSGLVIQAADILRRGLRLDVSGAYWVDPARPGGLTLIATTGLPGEFTDVAGRLPLSDFGEVADIPYNQAHGSCYGDFFAPVVGAFGVRAWLVASLTAPHSQEVLGALLLGSHDGDRFGHDDARQALSLTATVSGHLANTNRREDSYGLAPFAQAA